MENPDNTTTHNEREGSLLLKAGDYLRKQFSYLSHKTRYVCSVKRSLGRSQCFLHHSPGERQRGEGLDPERRKRLQIFTHNINFQTRVGMAGPREIWHYVKFVYMPTHSNGSRPLETISGSSLIPPVSN